jgi:hypothetical protein
MRPSFGAAIFGDVGRTWGHGVIVIAIRARSAIWVRHEIRQPRSGLGNVLHIDLAFPLSGDRNISKTQFLIQTKASH